MIVIAKYFQGAIYDQECRCQIKFINMLEPATGNCLTTKLIVPDKS